MKAPQLKAFNKLPASSTCRLIPFRTAVVVPGFLPKTFFLIVSGIKPWVTMTVELRPLIYIRRPEYWGIEVVGCQHGIRPAENRALQRRARYLAPARHQRRRGDRRDEQEEDQGALRSWP